MGKLGRLRAARVFSVASIAVSTLGIAEAHAQGRDRGAAPAPAPMPRAKGDCATALDSYDAAARTTIDPNLRRDRGLCHEQLGHPFPAIDDYRYYLTAKPDAPDADDIRNRLARLEEQVGETRRDADNAQKSQDRDRKGVKASMSVSINGSTEGQPRSLDVIEKNEKLDEEADSSPLRRGTGFEIGVAIDGARFTKATYGWTEMGALDLRFSVSSVSTILLEFGVAHVNAGGTASALGGAMLAGGYEARIPLNARLDDAFLVGGLLAYEHLSQPASGAVYSTFVPKLRLGYRHVIGPSFGLEASLDGGIAILHLNGAPAGIDATQNSPIFGLHLGAIVGF